MRRPRIQVVTGRRLPWVRLVAGNGEIILSSEGYDSVGNARRAAKRLKRLIPFAILEEGDFH